MTPKLKRRQTDTPFYSSLTLYHWLFILLWVATVPFMFQLDLVPALFVGSITSTLSFVPLAIKLKRTKNLQFWASIFFLTTFFGLWVFSNMLFVVFQREIFPIFLHVLLIHLAFTMVSLFLANLHAPSLVSLLRWFTPLFIYGTTVMAIRLLFPDIDWHVLKSMYRVIDISLVMLYIDVALVRKQGGQLIKLWVWLFIGWAIMDFFGMFGSVRYGTSHPLDWSDDYTKFVSASVVSIIVLIALTSLFDDNLIVTTVDSTVEEKNDHVFGFTADLTLTFLPIFILLSPGELATEPRLILSFACVVSASLVLANYRQLQRTLHKKNLKLTSLAFTDELTQIYNRTGLQEHIEEISFTEMTVVFIDLNGFKDINDQYGHVAGDHLLRVIATRLSDVFPRDAVLARYGGDEFVGLIPDFDDSATNDFVNTIVQTINLRVPFETIDLHVTATIGIAKGTQGEDLIELIENADSDMYVKKTQYYADKKSVQGR